MDEFDQIYESVSKVLNLPDSDQDKFIDLNNEILVWRAVIRSTGYFSSNNYSNLPKNIHNEVLSEDMLNFSDNIKRKRELFWKAVEEGSPIENVKCDHLCVLPGKTIDGLLYLHDCSNEDND